MYRCSNFELKESMLNVLLRPVLLLLLLFLAFPSWSLTRVLLPPIACANRMRLNGFRSKGNLYLWSEKEEVVGSPHRQWAGLLSRALPVGAGGRSSLQAAAQRCCSGSEAQCSGILCTRPTAAAILSSGPGLHFCTLFWAEASPPAAILH